MAVTAPAPARHQLQVLRIGHGTEEVAMTWITIVALALAVLGQAPDEIARDLSMHLLRAPGIEVPAPRGETVYRGPAAFERTDPLAPQLDAVLDDEGGTVTLAIRYGDRRLRVPLTR
jgi:hypothetical protein